MYSCSISVRLPKLSPLSTASSMRGRLCSCSFGELVNFHTVSGTFLATQARVYIVHKLALLEDPDSYLLRLTHSNTHNLPMLHSPIPSSYGLIWPRDCVVQSTLGQIAGQGMCTVQCIPPIVGLCTVPPPFELQVDLPYLWSSYPISNLCLLMCASEPP